MIRRLELWRWTGAVLMLLCGAIAWEVHVAAVRTSIQTQSRLARELLTRSQPLNDPSRIVAAIGQPGLRVSFFVFSRGTVYEWVRGTIDAHRPDPFGAPPSGTRRMPPPRSIPALLAADLAHIRPGHVQSDVGAIDILPDSQGLLTFALLDAAAVAIALTLMLASIANLARAVRLSAYTPLEHTTQALEQLAAGDFRVQQIAPGEAPHIARLAHAYNAAAATVARSIEERSAAEAEYRRFLADAGHELRTPLTIVIGFVDILAKRHADDPTDLRIVEGMRAQSARMRGLVEKLLLLARLEAQAPVAVRVDVRQTVEQVVEELGRAYPNRSIVCAAAPEAPVLIDEDDLFEALRNLVENALRYAPDSDVRIAVRRVANEIQIAVIDRGPGIPAHEHGYIFERFYRGSDRPGGEGSGLGLSIVRSVVERWNGSVELESSEGVTRFLLRFPAASEQVP